VISANKLAQTVVYLYVERPNDTHFSIINFNGKFYFLKIHQYLYRPLPPPAFLLNVILKLPKIVADLWDLALILKERITKTANMLGEISI